MALHQRDRWCPAGDGLQRKLEEWCRNLGINSFVRLYIDTVSAAEIKESLPADKAPWSSCEATQVHGVDSTLFLWVENHAKEWLSVIAVEIGAVRGPHHAVPKSVDDLKLYRNKRLVMQRVIEMATVC